jgi:hypothetical protein
MLGKGEVLVIRQGDIFRELTRTGLLSSPETGALLVTFPASLS